MKISQQTTQALQSIITGDGNLAPYRSGPLLIAFFNQFGRTDTYGQGFPSRGTYTIDCIESFNGTDKMQKVMELAVDPRHFLNSKWEAEKAVEYLNTYLDFDGYQIIKSGKYYKVIQNPDQRAATDFQDTLDAANNLSHAFIIEQLEKARTKLANNDYDGAITNARSLVEAVLEEIIRTMGKEVPKHDGDLNKLYKAVKEILNLNADQKDLSDTLKQVLTGLVSVVSGLAGMSNKLGDRHSRSYKPEKHHAQLAVTLAQAFCDFIFDTYEYQIERGLIKKVV